MPHAARRLARLIEQLESRVTDVEQGRSPDAPTRKVENVPGEDMTAGDSVSETKVTNPKLTYNSDNYNEGEYA